VGDGTIHFIGGDFNIIYYLSETWSTPISPAVLEFFEFIFDQGPMDIPPIGENFTWSSRDPSVWSKIDRFLPSSYWEPSF
jgi:hypothetical protein